jgi:polyhydroxyalkanoate synthesis repressor PhaR
MPVIKRYANRKLYDTEAKQYITLDGIADLIRKGEDVQVIDHQTGDDITALVTAQIIFAQEKKTSGMMPPPVLKNLIRAGSDTLNQLRHTFTLHPDWEAQVDAEIERRVQTLIQQGELSEEEGLRLQDKLLAPGRRGQEQRPVTDADIQRALEQRGLPSRAELERLMRQVETLSADLERLVPKSAGKKE